MKSLFFLLMTAALMAACNNGQGYKQPPMVNANELTDIQWIDSTKDLGKIREGQTVEVLFRFKNTGSRPLVIRSVHPGCGCTVAETPTEPIAPGAEGEIKASFNSKGRAGINHKSIDVDANTRGAQLHKLEFNVEVIPQ